MEQNETVQRQLFRLRILEILCKELDFDPTRILSPYTRLFELFPDESEQNIVKEMIYLKSKGYLTFYQNRMGGIIVPMNIKIEVAAIDLVEKKETKEPLSEYERDFSKDALMSFSNISNSQIIINSQHVSISNIGNNEIRELLNYFEDLAEKNKTSSAAQFIIFSATEKIKNNQADKKFLSSIANSLKEIGVSLATNLLTAGVQKWLGLN